MRKIEYQKFGKVAHLVLGGSTMEDLTLEDAKQLITFYRQKSSDMELANLQWQLKYNRLLTANSQSVPATKITKSKSE